MSSESRRQEVIKVELLINWCYRVLEVLLLLSLCGLLKIRSNSDPTLNIPLWLVLICGHQCFGDLGLSFLCALVSLQLLGDLKLPHNFVIKINMVLF